MKHYKQTTNYTCGPSCVLTILNHYWPKKFLLNKENEYEIWLQTVNPLIRGCPAFALAKILQDYGLITRVIYRKEFSSMNYIKRYIKPIDFKVYRILNLLRKKQALKSGVKYEKRKIKFDEIKKWLKLNDFIILLVEPKTINKNLKRRGLHWILITDYKNGKFLIYDSLSRKKWLSEELLKLAFDNVRKLINCDNKAVLVKNYFNKYKFV